MKPQELEAALRTLWTKSQVPFDRDNLAAFTGLDDKKLTRLMTGLVKSGSAGIESIDGDVCWTMPLGGRPIDGPETLERFERLERMRAEVKAQVRARAIAKRTGAPLEDTSSGSSERKRATDEDTRSRKSRRKNDDDDDDDDDDGISLLGISGKAAKGALALVSGAAGTLDRPGTGGKKSYLASAGLSFMGPLGWFYAGSFREAVPATMLFALVAWILPNPILWPLLWLVMPVSALTGLAYAFQYNRTGERRPLLLKAPPKKKKKKKDDDDE